ncbi:uncharacterized protein N7484_008201 [Penicillium longicatenatum]|uniref:uncharacterized protein n=1 Tax=Penicillium longicatenatum TaxID=1561947 RepID=UPI0025470AB5|nr:uncharacterized protein N7484_008201 [Penicillium longicatenatum]KAJ5640339.1 hypothetical protein N7484_008201 [Penicillium longicatenatum]
MLETLPYEILSSIAEWLAPETVRSLSQVSSRLYSVLAPLSYRTLTFRAASEWALNVLDIDTFFALHRQSGNRFNLEHARNLSISAPIQIARFHRCAYYNVFRDSGLARRSGSLGTSNEAKAHEQFLDDISRQLKLIFSHLQPSYLLSFEWRLGTCIPAGFLDSGGFLSKQQKQLSYLSLVTDGSCPHAGGCLNGLHELSSLKSLSWEGIQHPAEIESLRKCITRNSAHLTKLSISFATEFPTLDFYHAVFGLPMSGPVSRDEITDSAPPCFPRLVCLMLSKASLPLELRPVDASIFCQLQSLKLRDCANDVKLLGFLSRFQTTMRLRLFEFCCDTVLHYNSENSEVNLLVDFLLSFKGLKHLHLKLSNFSDVSQVEIGITNHRSTLESLIYHDRELVSIDDEGLFEDTRDQQPIWTPRLTNVVSISHIYALGLCASPSDVRLALEPFASTSNLRVLHLRFSGSEKLHRDIQQEIITHTCQRRAWCSYDCCQDHYFEFQSCSSSPSDLPDIIEDSITCPGEGSCNKPFLEKQGVRHSSEAHEFLQFAEWAFGPTGLTRLQVLALGDFSHENRYHRQQFLVQKRYQKPGCGIQIGETTLCCGMASKDYCAANVEDPLLRDYIMVDDSNFLSICPEGSLMESPYA